MSSIAVRRIQKAVAVVLVIMIANNLMKPFDIKLPFADAALAQFENLGNLAYSQFGPEPSHKLKINMNAGDASYLGPDTTIMIKRALFTDFLMIFNSNVNSVHNRTLSTQFDEDNSMAILQTTITAGAEPLDFSNFSCGVIAPSGKFFKGQYQITNEKGFLPPTEITALEPGESRTVYFMTKIPRTLVHLGGNFSLNVYFDSKNYSTAFSPESREPLLQAGDKLISDEVIFKLVAVRQSDTLYNSDGSNFKQGEKSSYDGFIEIIADVTNLTDAKINPLKFISCHRLEGNTSGLASKTLPGYFSGVLWGDSKVINGYQASLAEIGAQKTERIHFFWNTKAGDSPVKYATVFLGSSTGFVEIPTNSKTS